MRVLKVPVFGKKMENVQFCQDEFSEWQTAYGYYRRVIIATINLMFGPLAV